MAASILSASDLITHDPTSAQTTNPRLTLDRLDGTAGQVTGLDPNGDPAARDRLMDMGLTPGAIVQHELSGPFGSVHAYRVRGTLVALRPSQASMVWVEPV